jgi:subtilisin family serine protease
LHGLHRWAKGRMVESGTGSGGTVARARRWSRAAVAGVLGAMVIGLAGTPVASAASSIANAPELTRPAAASPRSADPSGEGDGMTKFGSASTSQLSLAAEQFVVDVRDPQVLADVIADVGKHGVAVTNSWNGAVAGFSSSLDARTARRLRARDGVLSVEREGVIKLSGTQRGAPWNLDRIDQRSRRLNSVYSYRNTGRGVTAYVLDTGIRRTHAEFRGRIGPGAYFDFGDGTGITDCNGHGTHVAGTLGGTTWGVAKAVTIVPVKGFNCAGASSDPIVIGGINWIIRDHPFGQPAVANMSFGGRASPSVDRAVQKLIQDGVTVVVAAGNDAAPTCLQSPARVPAAITVAASTRGDDQAVFSNFGRCNDLFAPGVLIRSASNRSNTGWAVMSGTSMSAPHVAGAAALILQQRPSARPAQVWAAIDADTTRGAISECCGSPDKLLHVNPPATRPSAPRSLRATSANRAVKLSWLAPATNGGAPVTDYVVQWSATRGASWSTVRDGVSTARRTTVGGLVNGRRYFFRVAARNHVGTGAWSNSPFTVPATTTSPPRSLAARGANRAVTLIWTAPATSGGAAITDYVIQRSANGGASWSTVRDGVSTARRTTVGGLTNGHRYHFRVAARNRAGVSGWSNVVAAVPATTPGRPSGVAATGVDEAVELSWSPPANTGGSPLTEYRVQYRPAGTSAWFEAPGGPFTSPAATIPGLTNGTTYEFRVAAVNAVGSGAFTDPVAAVPATVPGPPTDLVANEVDGAVELSWSPPDDDGGDAIIDYLVEQSTASGGPWQVVADGAGTAPSALVPGLTNGTEYWFRVSAINDLGGGSPTPSVPATPNP